jgi:hypothetical protein
MIHCAGLPKRGARTSIRDMIPSHGRRTAALCGAISFLAAAPAWAGMAMPRFADMARARIEVISFFVVGFLLLALVYRWLWNSLARDFPKLPHLSYRGALGALIVSGLFIYVVLTMISGARELLTPGAWERSGVMYKIREPEQNPKPWLDTARRASLERLRGALWKYASQHGGSFPPDDTEDEIPGDAWLSIDPNGLALVYLPGAKQDVGVNVIAYEPATFGANRFVLLIREPENPNGKPPRNE